MPGFFKWNARKPEEPAAAPAPSSALPSDPISTSKVFPRVVSALSHMAAPVLLDLGPIVGSNISFFGDRMACKIYVEDLFADVDRFAKRGEREQLATFLATRLVHAEESVDGVMCWDLFDFLDKTAGQVLAKQLSKIVRKGGIIYGFFGAAPADLATYTRYIVEPDEGFRLRTTPATPFRRTGIQPRDMIKMFDPLVVAESVLLKTNTRETLLRKP